MRKFQLSWGATLYSLDEFPLVTEVRGSRGFSESRTVLGLSGSSSSWEGTSGAVMTSMVATLSLGRLMSEFLSAHVTVLKVDHIDRLLTALEAQHWHARCFNDNIHLRTQLKNHNFMQSGIDDGNLPSLLEQEVQTASRILQIVFEIYSSAKNSAGGVVSYLELDAFAGPWVSR